MAKIYYDIYEEDRWIAGQAFDDTDTARIQIFLGIYPNAEGYTARVTQIDDPISTDSASVAAGASSIEIEGDKIVWPLGGQFLLDPNEINGWGVQGVVDDTNSQDLGNVGTANLSRVAGGLCFPFDVKVKRLFVWHRNNNNAAEAWGWMLAKQVKNAASNTVSTAYIIDETTDNGGVGPRDYLSTVTQNTDIDLSSNTENILPSGDVLVLGVASPTAVTTNRYVNVFSGYIELERV